LDVFENLLLTRFVADGIAVCFDPGGGIHIGKANNQKLNQLRVNRINARTHLGHIIALGGFSWAGGAAHGSAFTFQLSQSRARC
jgi:hypothetical protein